MAKAKQQVEIPLEKRLLWSGVIIAVALILRLIFLFQSAESTIFGYLSFDRLYYQQIAQQFLAGMPFEHELLFKPQLYSFLLGLVFKYLKPDLFVPLLIQGFMDAISCALIFLIALRFYPLRTAATAGLIAALYGTFIYYTGEFLPVTLIIMLNLLVIFLLLRCNDTRNSWYALYAGVALGLSASAGPSALLFLIAILIWIFRRDIKRRVKRGWEAGLLIAGALLVLTPFWWRAMSAGDEEVPFATHIGIVMAMGNNSEAQGNTMDLPRSLAPDGFDYRELVPLSHRANLGERPLDQLGSLWLGQAVDYIVSNPGEWLKLELRKLGYLLMGYENWRHKPMYYFASETQPTKYLLWDKYISFPFGLILPLALIALFAVRADKRRQGLLIGYAAVGVIVLLFSYVAEGQRLIFVPVVIIWAAAGLWAIIDRFREQDYKLFYRLIALLVAAIVIVNGLAALPGLSPRVNDGAVGEVYSAIALMRLEQYTDARLHLERALRLDPRLAEAHTALGNLHNLREQFDLAIESYRRAVRLDPDNQIPNEALANLLQRTNQLEELNHYIVGIIRRNPRANWAHEFYARMHMRLEEYMQAADIMDEAYQADSTFFEAIFIKAEVYLQADMRVEAERELRHYLQFMPNSIEAHANLGQVYARQHRFDEALAQFVAVRNVQPWSPASYFNLATLQYQMGDFGGAHAHLDTVLFLNPEFPGVDVMRAKIDSALTVQQER